MAIFKAGAIILNADNKVLLLFRKKQNDWSFPKGHVEVGEKPIDAMKREVFEETGLEVEFIELLPSLCYEHSKEGAVTVVMFLVRAQVFSKIKKEFPEDQIDFFPLESVSQQLSYSNLKDYFESILMKIKDLIEEKSTQKMF